MHNRAAVLQKLRRLLPGAADERKTLPFGLAALDSCLPAGGLARGALHEIVPAPHGIPAAFGFIAAILSRIVFSPPPCGEGSGVGVGRWHLNVDAIAPPRHPPPGVPVAQARRGDPSPPPTSLHSGARKRDPGGGREKIVFILPTYGLGPYGRLHGHGLRALGLDLSRLILIETARRKDTLWAIEEALHSGAPATIAGIVDQLDLKTSQRLQLAATDAGLPLFLLRPAQNLESSAASTRWRVGTAEAARDRFGLIMRPRWHLRLERARNGRPGEWVVEYDHVAHRFSLAAALADPARARGTGEKAERKSRCA